MGSIAESSYAPNELIKLKDAFAQLIAAGTPWEAAATTVLDQSFMNASDWLRDPYVQQRILAYRRDAEFAGKELMSCETYSLAVQCEMMNESHPYDYRYKMFHLFARVQKFIETGNGGFGRNSHIVNNGMIVMSDHGTREEWAEGSRAQQIELLASVAKNE